MTEARAHVVAISISRVKGIRKTNVLEAMLVENGGLKGDAHASDGLRQLSLLAIENIEKIRSLGLDVHPGDFAENITTSGLDTRTLNIGDRLQIGDAVVEITQIGKECHAPCLIYQQVGECVMPREGLFARVIRGGVVRPTDLVTRLDGARQA